MKKLSFAFTADDEKMLTQVKKDLAPALGKVTNIVAIRAALRRYVQPKGYTTSSWASGTDRQRSTSEPWNGQD